MALGGGVLVLCLMTGCSTLTSMNPWTKKQDEMSEKKELVIPDLNTAKEQYLYAERYQQVIMGYVNPDKKKREIQQDKVAQVHRRVVRNFPNDQEYTPLSRMTIADCDARMGRMKQAIAQWQDVMNQYPSNELIQCRAKFSTARAYESLGDFAKAKELDREIIDKFAGSGNGRVRAYAAQSQQAYLRTREETVKKVQEPSWAKKIFNKTTPEM